jgi:hypothetical protein
MVEPGSQSPSASPDDNNDQHHKQNDQQHGNRVVHSHSYSTCLMCQVGRHALCEAGNERIESMTGQGDRWKYSNVCDCKANGHRTS